MIVDSVSVLICTFNRAPRLARTLEYFCRIRHGGDYRVEVIVVDNNSSDDTAAVVAKAARDSAVPLHYAFERQQGKGFALNHGLSLATGDVIALTDDDVDPSPEWVDRIVQLFRTHDVVFVGGRVMANWETPPPAWLTTKLARDIWGPIALCDFGDEQFFYRDNPHEPYRPIGANMAVRRNALTRVGGWRTDLGKVNGGLIPGEDFEIYFRLHAGGDYRGMYDPHLTVRHDVPSSRVTFRYFARWFFAAGQAHARMATDLYPGVSFERARRIAGVPGFFYRELAERAMTCLRSVTRDRVESRVRVMQTIRLVGLMWECSRRPAGGKRPEIDNQRRRRDSA